MEDLIDDSTPAPLRREAPPCEHAVQKVMQDLGFDLIQARNHVRCAELLRSVQPVRSMAQPE